MELMTAIRRVWAKVVGNGKNRMLMCIQCHTEFVFEEGEQMFFRQKGLTEPKRCSVCRQKNRNGRPRQWRS